MPRFKYSYHEKDVCNNSFKILTRSIQKRQQFLCRCKTSFSILPMSLLGLLGLRFFITGAASILYSQLKSTLALKYPKQEILDSSHFLCHQPLDSFMSPSVTTLVQQYAPFKMRTYVRTICTSCSYTIKKKRTHCQYVSARQLKLSYVAIYSIHRLLNQVRTKKSTQPTKYS